MCTAPTVRTSVATRCQQLGNRAGESLYGEVQCIMGNGHTPCEQTDTHDWKQLFSSNFVGGR